MRMAGVELQNFSEYCGQRGYEAQNGGYRNVTSLQELDKLTSRLHKVQESIRQLREVVAQPSRPEEKLSMPMTNGYPHHEPNVYSDEPKSANMYPPPEKRRRGVSRSVSSVKIKTKQAIASCSSRPMPFVQSCRNSRVATRT
jgi:hypothetical protein